MTRLEESDLKMGNDKGPPVVQKFSCAKFWNYMRSYGAFGKVVEHLNMIRIMEKWHMFEVIYRREAIYTKGDKRYSIELRTKNANENYGLWRLLLRDTEVKK